MTYKIIYFILRNVENGLSAERFHAQLYTQNIFPFDFD